MKRETKKYTAEEISYLKINYGLESIEEIEKNVLHSRKSIYKKANELGLIKTMPTHKIAWTEEMIEKLKNEFPTRLTNELVKEFGFSYRTIIRKARELNIDKSPEFFQINREKLNQIIKSKKAPNPMKGVKGFIIPNSEQYYFKKGELPKIDYEKALKTRLETLRKEKLRLKYGLPQKTKIKLVNFH